MALIVSRIRYWQRWSETDANRQVPHVHVKKKAQSRERAARLTREADCGRAAVYLDHVCAAAELPRHHVDPFDRLLIAQARAEGLVFLSHHQYAPQYDLKVVDPCS